MHLTRAVSQISEIHEHLVKGEVYRGYRALPIAASGLVGLAAALLQPAFVWPGGPAGFVGYWLVVAAIAGLTGMGEIPFNYLFRDDAEARRRTRRVVGQFAPCLAAGVAAGWAFAAVGRPAIDLLPGVWTLIFALGVFASRPYLPRATGWVGLFYFLAGAYLLVDTANSLHHAAWRLAGTFAVGQLATALVLYSNLERDEHA